MKNAIMKVTFKNVGDETKYAATERLKKAALALETSPDMQFGFTTLRRVHTEDRDGQSLTLFFGTE